MLWATALKYLCWSENNHFPNSLVVFSPWNIVSLNPHLPGHGPVSSLSALSHSSHLVPHPLQTDSGVNFLSIHFGQTEWATTKLVDGWPSRTTRFYNSDILSRLYIADQVGSLYIRISWSVGILGNIGQHHPGYTRNRKRWILAWNLLWPELIWDSRDDRLTRIFRRIYRNIRRIDDLPSSPSVYLGLYNT